MLKASSFVLVMLAGLSPGFAEAQAPTEAGKPVSRPTVDLRGSGDTEYRLNYGDVLELSVRGFPELRQKAMIEPDGEVSLPLAGRVRVVGMPLASAQAVIKSLATPRPLHQRFADGRDGYVALALDDVLVTLAEYRPIYIMGDVGKPGELPYRPGMTARQAIALGGGFDIMRYRLVNPFIESADLKGQHEVLWTDAARVRVRLKRVEVELDGKSELDPNVVADIPLDKAYLDEIVKTETETLKRRRADYASEIEHIRGLIGQAETKVDTLKKQLSTEVQGADVDQQELDQMKDFQKRGSLPLMRLMEIRRIQLANATRVLQTRVQSDQAERELAEAKRSLERLNNTYRTALLAERQEQSALYNSLLARISANSEKLVHTSVLKSRLVRGRGSKVNIAIHRSLLDFKQTLVGTEDTPLAPGDTVEIALEGDNDVDAAIRRARQPVRAETSGVVTPSTTVDVKSGASAEAQATPASPSPAGAAKRVITPRAR
ncbi:MAG: polysaccharide biosynthesis/export family protein [Hyphomicrobiaceae bacterium]